jgi:hypothetical protein
VATTHFGTQGVTFRFSADNIRCVENLFSGENQTTLDNIRCVEYLFSGENQTTLDDIRCVENVVLWREPDQVGVTGFSGN